jgi:hypothetical protein
MLLVCAVVLLSPALAAAQNQPAPSVEQLHAIVAACDAPPTVETSLIASLDAGDLADVVAQVEALPPDTIPPACAADVIAVAEALQGA